MRSVRSVGKHLDQGRWGIMSAISGGNSSDIERIESLIAAWLMSEEKRTDGNMKGPFPSM